MNQLVYAEATDLTMSPDGCLIACGLPVGNLIPDGYLVLRDKDKQRNALRGSDRVAIKVSLIVALLQNNDTRGTI